MSKFESNHSILKKNKAQKELGGIQSLDKAIELLCKAEISGTTAARTVKEIAQSMDLSINQAHKHLSNEILERGKSASFGEIQMQIITINSVRNTVSDRQMKVKRINQQLQNLELN